MNTKEDTAKIKKREYNKDYYEKNRERESARKREWYLTNRDRIREKHKEYYLLKKKEITK